MQSTSLSLGLSLLCGAVLLPCGAAEDSPKRARSDIQRQVESLHQEDVAWRKIDWKTCLLDGLRASRQQQKPLILWVFIDRPMDDERC